MEEAEWKIRPETGLRSCGPSQLLPGLERHATGIPVSAREGCPRLTSLSCAKSGTGMIASIDNRLQF